MTRHTASRAAGTAPTAALSERQLEILRRVAAGQTHQQIARALDRAVITIRKDSTGLRAALGARSLAHAVHLAHGLRLLDRERHGDHASYEAHRRRGETPCGKCRAAERAYRQNLRTTTKETR
ncbi:LuxR C-terminal-related transcriptional regulator [Streptomyces sp. DSM 44915]|uniref:LuxR C-terminal-related transcriptional regulator n=1 Tax=Streptomyces chisholmiae TaxID=3075540 RepID=A0ABU2JZB6_9ACTN|nr:LuxR C-terminal-related transcriptional regulator [Streptomyces sp. DSM 44915]MDT0270275.1 LuxR C-terminal-related transcriptional regulator [Streptomyces sp. DSM 44915]MDT0270287.1 LuxR C-terminal-related transcriptional regulator [Streptomyces sp. DSM 44915]